MARKTKEEATETRNAILDAAECLFEINGVSRTSLAEIATAAGVTRGAVYWHFANKEDLFDAMVMRVVQEIEAKAIELQSVEDDDPVRQLGGLALFFINRIANDPRYQRIISIKMHKCEYVGEMARILDKSTRHHDCYLEDSEARFVRAREKGWFPDALDTRLAAVGLVALVDGLIRGWTMSPGRFPFETWAFALIEAYLRGLGCTALRTP